MTAEATATSSGQKYMVFRSQRLHVESVCYADELFQNGTNVHMEIFGSHRLSEVGRPNLFFNEALCSGIFADITSHPFDQFLHYTHCSEGTVAHALVEHRANPDGPETGDVGQAMLILDKDVKCFSCVDWFTPDGMKGWGNHSTFITGAEGCIVEQDSCSVDPFDSFNQSFECVKSNLVKDLIR